MYTAHCTPFTTHWISNFEHCTLHSVHRTLHTELYTLKLVHGTLQTAQYTIYNTHYILNTAHCIIKEHIARCTPFTTHDWYTEQTSEHLTLHTARSLLHTAIFTQHTAHFTQHTSHITRHTSHFTQHTSDLVKKKTPGVWTEHLVVEVDDDPATRVASSTLDSRCSNSGTSMRNSAKTELKHVNFII